MNIELDFSDEINANKNQELGFEEEISQESWAEEKGKGKTYEDHIKMKDMSYTHDSKKIKS
jgi:hypothetical protein